MTVYVFMCRHVYVYEYDCFMYVHTCTYCICMYVMTMYSAVRIPLVSNCAIYIRFIIIIIMTGTEAARAERSTTELQKL